VSAIDRIRQQCINWLPPLAGIGLIVLFVSLANWQLQRAAEKDALAELFASDAAATPFDELGNPVLFQAVTARGRYLNDRQFLIDNIIKENRLGHYVITPFELAGSGELVLVNRGWIEKPRHSTALPEIPVTTDTRDILARVGRLPRVALRPEQAIADGQGWPRVAVYPELTDIAAALQREVAPQVLLLDAAATDGYVRHWQPPERGSMMHYGYAFQWSALALTVLVVLIWQLRKKRRLARQA
jgi:surfeit locus 1 family protein